MATGHLGTRLVSATHPIALRNVELDDAAAVAAMLSDPRNNELDATLAKEPMPVDVAARMIGRMRESAATPTVVSPEGKVQSGPGRVNLLVVLVPVAAPAEGKEQEEGAKKEEEGDLVIGFGGFGDIKTLDNPVPEEGKPKIRVGDVGVMLNPEHRGKGYAAEAMRLAVDYGFWPASQGGLQLDKITSTTLIENAAIISLIEKKLGWKGQRRDSTEFPGKVEMFYEVYPSDWKS